MRLFISILVCTTLAASTIYKRTNGSTLILGDSPMEVDLSNVIPVQSNTAVGTTMYVASTNTRI
jgi:hypothetical protein